MYFFSCFYLILWQNSNYVQIHECMVNIIKRIILKKINCNCRIKQRCIINVYKSKKEKKQMKIILVKQRKLWYDRCMVQAVTY